MKETFFLTAICILSHLMGFGQAVSSLAPLMQTDPRVYPLLEPYNLRAAETDNDGRFWLASNSGLLLYDGHNIFQPVPALRDVNVLNLFKDPVTSNLWVYTINSFGILDMKTFQYHILRHISVKDEFQPAHIKLDADNHICVVFPDHTYYSFDNKGNVLKYVYLGRLFEGGNVTGFAITKDSLFFARRSFDPYIVALSLSSGASVLHRVENRDIKWIRDVEVVDGTHLLIADEERGFFMIDNKKSYKPVVTPVLENLLNTNSGGIFGFQKIDRDGLVLAFNSGRLYRFEMQAGMPKVSLMVDMPNELPHNYRSFIREIKNLYYLAYNENGLYLINKYNPGISRTLNGAEKKISTRNIVEDDNGDLYVATYQGLYYYDKSNGKWSLYNQFSQGSQQRKAIPFSLFNRGDYIYVGSESYPFYRFNKKRKQFETEFYTHPDFVAHGIWNVNAICLMEDPDRVLLGYARGLAVYDFTHNDLSILPNLQWQKAENTVYCIRPYSKGSFLVGTKLGLFLFNTQSGQYLPVPVTNNESIYDVLYLKDRKEIWVGTATKGVLVLNEQFQQLRKIGIGEGLPYPTIAGLSKGYKNNIWIITSNGLSSYENGWIVNYSRQDGLSDDGLNRFSYLHTDAGILYIGSIDGLSIINERELLPPLRDKVFVSQIKVWRSRTSSNETYSLIDLPADHTITINPGDRGLLFNIGTSNLSNIDKADFQYRIHELTPNWQNLGKSSELRFDGLPYGTLHLEIRCIGRNNLPSENVLRYTLHVRIPFYRSVFFYLGLSMLIIGITAFFIYQRAMTTRKLNGQRLMIAKTLHDELGVIFTGIRFRMENILKRKEETAPVAKALDDIYSLTRQASTAIYETLWIMDSEKDSIRDLSEKFDEINDMVLVPTGAVITAEFSITKDEQLIPPLYKQHLYYIYKEAANNIAKHSQPQQITIKVMIHDKNISMEFINDHLNKKTSGNLSNGLGLRNIVQRAREINCKVRMGMEDGCFHLVVESRPSASNFLKKLFRRKKNDQMRGLT